MAKTEMQIYEAAEEMLRWIVASGFLFELPLSSRV